MSTATWAGPVNPRINAKLHAVLDCVDHEGLTPLQFFVAGGLVSSLPNVKARHYY
jgi:hypothetical protein